MSYISITEAATLSGKSIQTVRRMIKGRKIEIKKEKTPQGFVYLIEKDSLEKFVSGNQRLLERSHGGISDDHTAGNVESFSKKLVEELKGEVGKFNTTVQKLIEQNERDKDNFFGLIKTFQERILQLESHIKLLESPKKKWWKLWS